ncbi:MAG: FtsX-like permease family protein [Ruminococcus sp.]|nr:FtsX-like permease family protein [Ruminococcus sp.]
MNFQTLLAKRYIFAQKRHSVLTLCSIIVALAFMSMLFSGFTTCFTSLRNIAYDKAPYHCLVYSVTKEQGELLSQAEGITSCVLKENPEGGTYQAQLLIQKYIDDEQKVLDAAFEKAGLGFGYMEMLNNFEMNFDLMQYDFVGVAAWYTVACTFALFFGFVIILAMAMRLVIDTAFEISSKERERQFGVLQSIGATPGQVVKIITMEGTLLSIIGIPIGLICGNALTYAAYRIVLYTKLMEAMLTPEKIEELVCFSTNPWMMLASAATGYVWVWLSAYATGMRIIKMSPMQAITSRTGTVKKVKKHSIYGLIFGWTGKLASRNARRSLKRFWITVVSLTVSITLFSTSSFAIDGFIDSYEGYLRSEGIDFDFSAGTIADDNDRFSYNKSLEEMKNSGYFKDLRLSINCGGIYEKDTDSACTILIDYCNEETYEYLFNGKPPISYEELTASGEYLMIEINQEIADPLVWENMQKVQQLDEITVEIRRRQLISIEEFEALPEEEHRSHEERRNYYEAYETDEETGEEILVGYWYTHYVPKTYHINQSYPIEKSSFGNSTYEMSSVRIIGTLPQYEKHFADYDPPFNGPYIECNLADHDSYRDALKFIENNKYLYLEWDAYGMNYAYRSSFTLVKIIMAFIALMVALISIVNMVNIVSTGLLNRRSELASMQCVGMTKGQMYGMTIVECLQYVLTSGVVASLLSFAVMIGMKYFIRFMTLEENFEAVISYTKPQGIVWICTAAAFVVALITALISIQGMQKQSLVDQIRSVD